MSYEQIIFLDIDGVFKCPSDVEYQDSDGQDLEFTQRTDFFAELSKSWKAEAIKHFHSLLEIYPDLKIVISSSQRHGYTKDTIKNLFKYYPKIQERIIDRTPSLSYGERGDEIQQFLDIYKVKKFVILDDESDMKHLLPRLVQTDFKEGFSLKDLDRVQYLMDKSSE